MMTDDTTLETVDPETFAMCGDGSLGARLAGVPHRVLGTSMLPPFPAEHECVLLGLGCFWGAERLLWRQPGVYTTAVGYAGGRRPHPSYEQLCTGVTGHAEVVLVVFDPRELPFERLLATFFEAHDPTQGMRQGNDIGTQYRSAIYTLSEAQLSTARAVGAAYAGRLKDAGRGAITTEVRMTGPFYYAELYHQQYLDKNPAGYCGLAGTGVSCPLPSAAS